VVAVDSPLIGTADQRIDRSADRLIDRWRSTDGDRPMAIERWRSTDTDRPIARSADQPIFFGGSGETTIDLFAHPGGRGRDVAAVDG
jgi:hypothetical protein